jgi:hypothetical protein
MKDGDLASMYDINTLINKKWEQITPQERQYLRDSGVLNWFGGAGQSWISRKFIGLILKDFNIASADKHDLWYIKWWDSAKRKECDEKFYQAMLQDIFDMYIEWRITKLEQVW